MLSVLDNGTNFNDKELRNLVIMADNEIEFFQMLGRKRFNETNENINLFLFSWTESEFKNRYTYYFDLYNKLTKYQNLSYKKVIDLLLKEELKIEDIRNYYTECEENPGYQRSDLSLEAIRLRYIFWADMNKKFEHDQNAFIKEQFTWLNIPFPETKKELLSYYVTYSKEDISEIVTKLENIYNEKYGIITKEEFDEISKELYDLASKIYLNFKDYSKKFEKIDAIMNYISNGNEYHFNSIQLDKQTYYELEQNKEHKIKIRNISKEDFEAIINKYEEVTDNCFKEVTDSPVPDSLSENDPLKQSFLSEIMKRNEALKEFTIKSSPNKLILSKRAKQVSN